MTSPDSDFVEDPTEALSKDGFVDILVVEDHASERASIVGSLRRALPGVTVVALCDGNTAMDFLLGRADWSGRADAAPPKLILLDLALPGADGFTILGRIRDIDNDDSLTLTPVVIFTDSQATSDVTRSYRCGANSYVMKPLSFPDFQAVVETVGRYWLLNNRAAL